MPMPLTSIEDALRERVKELSCLYALSSQFESFSGFDDSMNRIAEIVRGGFQYPEKISVRITLDDKVCVSDAGDGTAARADGSSGLAESGLGEDLLVSGKKRGEVRVSYADSSGFLPEEKTLLKEINRKISREVERIELRRQLVENLNLLESLITEKNCEVDECNKLNKALQETTDKLQENRRQLETFFLAITDPVVVIDSGYRVTMSNKSDVVMGGSCYSQLFCREDVCENCPARGVFSEGAKRSVEFTIQNSIYHVQAYPIKAESGETVQVIIKYNDVTKEKHLEEHLVQSYKLASLGKLVAGIAHEINNPNTFLHGNLKILREGFKDMLPLLDEEYKRNPELKIARLPYDVFRSNVSLLFDDMVNGTDRIRAIIEGLKHFARKNEESLVEELSINDVVLAGLHLAENELKRHVQIQTDLAENLPPCRGNSQKLEQVVINLLTNASQAANSKNCIVRVETGYAEDSREVYVRVTDNGCGIDEKTRKCIFDPFFTTKRQEGGTGLGLSISYGIVQEHKGRITCESEAGSGSAFTMYLPV